MNAVLAWLFGSVDGLLALLILCVTAVVIVALRSDKSVTHPRVTVFAVDHDKRIEITSDQPYAGPGRYRPDTSAMNAAAYQTAERFIGDVKKLPGPMQEHLGYEVVDAEYREIKNQ